MKTKRPVHEVSFGIVSDTHLCSKRCREDLLAEAYDNFAKRGLRIVVHAGNAVDGDFRLNAGEITHHGVEDQTAYFLDRYPRRKGVTTYLIDGNCHEGFWRREIGLSWGQYMADRAAAKSREDLLYLGFTESDMAMGRTIVRVAHPAGSQPQNISHPVQKLVDSYVHSDRPSVLVCGHHHLKGYVEYEGVHCFLAGSFQEQTTFLRRQRKRSELGYWIVTLHTTPNGKVVRCVPELFTGMARRWPSLTRVQAEGAKRGKGK